MDIYGRPFGSLVSPPTDNPAPKDSTVISGGEDLTSAGLGGSLLGGGFIIMGGGDYEPCCKPVVSRGHSTLLRFRA